jgi:pyruvate formate lyase activating enzyme
MELKRLKDATGIIFNIQSFCIHDGPGIRSTVFLKGCQYDCLWCHNPEGISGKRQLSFVQSKCILCGECVKICSEAHILENGKHIIHRDALPDELLDKSASVCLAKALTIVGSEVTAGEVLSQVKRDRRYYDESGGGVTISGGEPTRQKVFLAALLKLLTNEGIHTALETNGHCEYAYYESILPYVRLFLIDYKETDPSKHRDFTQADNKPVIENIKKLHDADARIVLRCPIIPGLNDRDDHFEGIAKMTKEYPALLGVEILPYHKLAEAKADRLGNARPKGYPRPETGMAELWRGKVRAHGGRVVEM